MGRADYNAAINQTEDEQMLLSIVKGRYAETVSLLAVSSVAANVRFKTNAGIEAGFGPDQSYSGNLVPFSGGLAIEENPTITYAPVQGEQYLRQLLSPIPLHILVLIMRSETNPSLYLSALVNRVNDMPNPDFMTTASGAPDLRFQKFLVLHRQLEQAGIIQWLADLKSNAPFDILISGYAPAYVDTVRTYLGLLGISMPTEVSKDIILPISFAVKRGKSSGIAISTRSTYDLIEILRAAVEIPQAHADAGRTIDYPPAGLVGNDIRIHTSKQKPTTAAVAVRHRGHWFYIDDADLKTKLYYLMVQTLWSVSIAAAADQNTAPLLTIPVSR